MIARRFSLLAAIVAAITIAPACSSTPTPESARTSVLSLAEANRLVAEACGDAAIIVATTKGKTAGITTAKECVDMHDRTHEQLHVLADAVDAWRDGKAGAPACEALDLRSALLEEIDHARTIDSKIPAAVDDAAAFLGTLIASQFGTCTRTDGGVDG